MRVLISGFDNHIIDRGECGLTPGVLRTHPSGLRTFAPVVPVVAVVP